MGINEFIQLFFLYSFFNATDIWRFIHTYAHKHLISVTLKEQRNEMKDEKHKHTHTESVWIGGPDKAVAKHK